MSAPTTTLHFTDNARAAALHLLDSPFGERLRQVGKVWEYRSHLTITYHPHEARARLSSGELILLSFLESMTYARGCDFAVCDLSGIDDVEWDRVIAALFLLRGRVMAVAS